mgnify:CR=1 FL=1
MYQSNAENGFRMDMRLFVHYQINQKVQDTLNYLDIQSIDEWRLDQVMILVEFKIATDGSVFIINSYCD